MPLDIKDWLEIVAVIAAVIGNFYVYKFRIDRQEHDFEDYKRQHAKEGDDWKDSHIAEKQKLEKDLWREIGTLRTKVGDMTSQMSERDLEIEREFGKAYMAINEANTKFATALEKLSNIEKKIDKLDVKLDTKADK